MLAAVAANLQRDPKVRAEPWGPADFFHLPDLDDAPETGDAMTPTQIKAVAHAITGWAKAKAAAAKEG